MDRYFNAAPKQSGRTISPNFAVPHHISAKHINTDRIRSASICIPKAGSSMNHLLQLAITSFIPSDATEVDDV